MCSKCNEDSGYYLYADTSCKSSCAIDSGFYVDLRSGASSCLACRSGCKTCINYN